MMASRSPRTRTPTPRPASAGSPRRGWPRWRSPTRTARWWPNSAGSSAAAREPESRRRPMSSPWQYALTVGPLGFYLWVLAVWQSGRRPRVVRGLVDFALLAAGLGGVVL